MIYSPIKYVDIESDRCLRMYTTCAPTLLWPRALGFALHSLASSLHMYKSAIPGNVGDPDVDGHRIHGSKQAAHHAGPGLVISPADS
jgi:hypothetical protein